MSEPKAHINERLHTEFADSGRIAGMGISYDRYGDESGGKQYERVTERVMLPSDYLTPEEKLALNGEVRIIKGGHRK